MRLLHPPSTYPLGIDISDSSIKIIQLNKTRHWPRLQAAAVIDLPEGFVVAAMIKNKAGVVKQLQTALKKPLFGKFSSAEVIMALPEQKTFTKVITVASAEPDITRAVEEELEKELPYALDEVSYDWQLIKKHQHQQEIIVSAAPLPLTQAYREVCAAADIIPIALEPEEISSARAFLPLRAAASETNIILDIGARHSSFIACLDNAVLYTVGLPFAGYDLSKKIAAELNITVPKAESAKIASGLNSRYLNEAINEMLIPKISAALRYLHTYYPAYGAVKKIYVGGGGSALNGLPELIASALRLPTAVGDVFTNINIKNATQHASVRQSLSGRFGAAAGAALRGVYHPEI